MVYAGTGMVYAGFKDGSDTQIARVLVDLVSRRHMPLVQRMRRSCAAFSIGKNTCA